MKKGERSDDSEMGPNWTRQDTSISWRPQQEGPGIRGCAAGRQDFQRAPLADGCTANLAAGLGGPEGVSALLPTGNRGNNENLGSLASEGGSQQQHWGILMKRD